MPKRKSNEVEWKGRKFWEKAGRFRFGGGSGGENLERGWVGDYPQGRGRTAQGMIGVVSERVGEEGGAAGRK